MRRGDEQSRGAAGLIVFLLLLALVVVVPFVLHVAQKRHNVLPFDVDAVHPPDKALVGGEAFGSTVAAIMEHELSGTTGWRPNDLFLWGPGLWADNNANRQLGIIRAVRESVRVLRDHLTKISADEFDPHLEEAEAAFRFDAERFMLPSAEGKFGEGVVALRRYVAGLQTDPPTSRKIQRRNVELIRLFQAWTDLLGDAHATLFKDTEADGSSVRTWKTDDYFYHAQGVTHALYHLTLAVRREYAVATEGRPTIDTLLDEVATALGKAALLKPLVVLDGGPDGLLANHRRNLDGYVVEARQKMYSIREELEK